MRLSTTDVYAFQALAYLGMQGPDRWIASEEISEQTGVARPYLVRILAALAAKGVVKSKKGIGGGYALARKPHLVSLCEVVRAIDGPVAPLSCISLNWREPCPEQDRCHARNTIYTRMRDAMLTVLQDFSVADLVQDRTAGVDYHYCLGHLLKPNA
ncbi:Rrf2 family transcriptional regulator [Deinococcus maricopensis]|uniref:Transcriptional regulator, BadM/Rrf2 family n=1 Tax=Deinococcus maricopensis (strain DSM 21211 / LMG 22137 / NRRL B-23946 / LB-34) TaxID=709986 RepID=E8U934_DEIML|nr:RrF2 family transcriptional regulator [Deinococcus maricopensis]ADV67573.1 transcriptional regulator, BadM/Rrf2 family [Deinococcus maricopensis DSM 21211]